jgi:perosamine synthetase
VNFHNVHISPQSIERVTRALASGWVSEGPAVAEFERELSAQLGLSRPVAVNSGTAALHLALELAFIGRGSEVIIPAQTFAATGTAVLQCGARVVFADIDSETGNLDPKDVERRLTEDTSAIIPVHYGGLPCDMDALKAIAKRNALIIIEDAAHALGAKYKGVPVGAVSDYTAFSFQAIKHLTCGDGGALCCPGEYDYEEARRLRWFGIDRTAPVDELGYRNCNIHQVGFKYHMNDIAASVGLGNMEGFADRLARRKSNGEFYRRELAGVDGVKLLRIDPGMEHAYWLFTLLVEKRLDFVRALKARGVPALVVHRRIDASDVFDGWGRQHDDLPGTDYFDQHQISIPVHDALTDEDLAQVVGAIREGWG